MTWFTLRQFRTRTWIAIAALVATGVLLLITGWSIAEAYADAGVASCGGDCSAAIDSFLRKATTGTNGAVNDLAMILQYAAPAVIGIFWGAPLIARELETGTHQLAWNQSVTRTRWLATKLAVIGSATVTTTGLLTWAVTAWASRVDQVAGDRITPAVYGARGLVPVGYAAFAFALAVTAGVLIRRTVPAMAAALGIYAAVAFSVSQWIRAHLVPANHTTPPLDTSTPIFIDGENVVAVRVQDPERVWVLSNQVITSNGEVYAGQRVPESCGGVPPGENEFEDCVHWVRSLGLRQDLTFHPDSHFWPIQWTETGILVGVAALLVGFCFWWLRHRLT
jgi:ABC-type transport system involved in multi-copper enzyme maturation permease subunit